MKATAKVAFYFAGTAIEVPVGATITVHQEVFPAATGTLAGFKVYEEGPDIYVRVESGIIGIPARHVTALDWNGRRYQDRIR